MIDSAHIETDFSKCFTNEDKVKRALTLGNYFCFFSICIYT